MHVVMLYICGGVVSPLSRMLRSVDAYLMFGVKVTRSPSFTKRIGSSFATAEPYELPFHMKAHMHER